MKISELLNKSTFFTSVEVFPPKTDEALTAAVAEIIALKQYNPAFISVTYGAGGSHQGRSVTMMTELTQQFTVMAHFTCVNTHKDHIDTFMEILLNLGVQNVMALRGDIPKDLTKDDVLSDFKYANELVDYVKQTTLMDVAVACYPEIHPEALSRESDAKMLMQKMDAGAEMAISQLFYDNEAFYRLHDNMISMGMRQPIIPGILPITNFKALQRTIDLSSTQIPKLLMEKLLIYHDDDAAIYDIGMTHALKQCNALKSFGVKGIHLYSLNKRRVVEPILQVLSP